MRRAAASILLGLCACASEPSWKREPHDRYYQVAPSPELHPAPPSEHYWSWWSSLVYGAIDPLGELVSPGNYLRQVGVGAEALDINAFGQVLESPWFTPRIGRRSIGVEELVSPPLDVEGLGPWTVIAGKVEGATPGLVMKNAAGEAFVVKFDPPAFPGMASGAEVIVSRILWAAGYNLPDNRLGVLNIRNVLLAPNAKTTDEYGDPVPLDQARLHAIAAHVNPLPDGTVRAMFSRLIPGQILGHGSYRSTRATDPNDRIPHQRRRSLRGLWLFSAWLNNTDPGDPNTLDVFVKPNPGSDLGYVRHYLLDFGDALGASGVNSKYVGQGYELFVDWTSIFTTLFSIGIVYPYWLPVRRSPFRSVGVFESEIFDPGRWRPDLPNPAFEAATAADTYWAASLIARLRPEMIWAIVAAARYPEPAATDYLVRILLERREKCLRYAFAKTLPLDDPRIEGRTKVVLTDLALENDLLTIASSALSWTLRHAGQQVATGEAEQAAIDLAPALGAIDRAALSSDPFVTLELRRARVASPSIALQLRVIDGVLLPVALSR